MVHTLVQVVYLRERSLFMAGGRPVEIGKSRALKFCPPPSTIAHYVFAPPLETCTEILPPLQLLAPKFYVPSPFPPPPPGRK